MDVKRLLKLQLHFNLLLQRGILFCANKFILGTSVSGKKQSTQ